MEGRLFEMFQAMLSDPLPGEVAHKSLMPHGRKYQKTKGGDAFFRGPHRVRQSAVLILLTEAESLTVPFIRRAEDNGPHSGQIALPGGGREKQDDNIVHTALRETEEEIGLNRDLVAVAGTLTPLYIDVSNYLITPVVGIYDGAQPFQWTGLVPHIREVAQIIPVPLCELAGTRKNRIVHTRLGRRSVPSYSYGGETVWGATAMIIAELLVVTRAARLCSSVENKDHS